MHVRCWGIRNEQDEGPDFRNLTFSWEEIDTKVYFRVICAVKNKKVAKGETGE